MTEGSARDDVSDTVAPGAPVPGTASPATAGGDGASPDAASMDEDPPDDAHPDAVGHDDGARQEDAHDDAHDDTQGHDQPTRPAYGHLYGVERSLDSFLPLQDVVFAVDEAFLEALRDFAAHALADMRRLGADYDHLHFRDVARTWHESWPDIILVAPRPPAEPVASPMSDDDAQGVDSVSDR